MGLVYLGEHTLLRRRAAIKTLLPTVAANREIVERFFNEARATSAIADPGVIQVYDFGYHVDGTAYIVMELLEGEALSARLDRLGRFPLGDALRFARQVAGSLAAAHARDIVHRDLKPENIFLVRDSEAQGGERTKIIDFGICKMGSGDPTLTEAGAMIGTPVYMSPEQCRGSGDVDARSDIYAFGCLLFHMITGRPPFIGDASGDLIVAHLQEEPPPAARFAPELPAEVDGLLARCLAKEPGERFASMTALQVELGELAALAEAAAPPAAASPRTVPLGRGFRSVFDANLAAVATGSALSGMGPGSPIPQALRSRLWFASPPPGSTPPSGEADHADNDADDAEDDIAELRQGSGRLAVRAALACVLVVGAALGLVLTLSRGDNEPTASTRFARVTEGADADGNAASNPATRGPARTDHSAVPASDQLAAKDGAGSPGGARLVREGDAKFAATAGEQLAAKVGPGSPDSARLAGEGDTKFAAMASEQVGAKDGAGGARLAGEGDTKFAATASEQLAANGSPGGAGLAGENDNKPAATAGDGRGAQAGDKLAGHGDDRLAGTASDQLAASGGADAADKAAGQADDSADQDDDGGTASKAAKKIDDRRSRSRAAESRAGKPASASRTSRAVRSAPASAPVVRPSQSAPPSPTSPPPSSGPVTSPSRIAPASPAAPPPAGAPAARPSTPSPGPAPTASAPAAGSASTAPRPAPPPEDLYDTR